MMMIFFILLLRYQRMKYYRDETYIRCGRMYTCNQRIPFDWVSSRVYRMNSGWLKLVAARSQGFDWVNARLIEYFIFNSLLWWCTCTVRLSYYFQIYSIIHFALLSAKCRTVCTFICRFYNYSHTITIFLRLRKCFEIFDRPRDQSNEQTKLYLKRYIFCRVTSWKETWSLLRMKCIVYSYCATLET